MSGVMNAKLSIRYPLSSHVRDYECSTNFALVQSYPRSACAGIIYIFKVVISVCLIICPIINHEPFDRLASSFNWGTRRPGKYFSRF